MTKRKSLLVSLLSSILLLTTIWLAKAEIRGFFLSCGLHYVEVESGMDPEYYVAMYDLYEALICGGDEEILEPETPLQIPNGSE